MKGFSFSKSNIRSIFRHPTLMKTMLTGNTEEIITKHVSIEINRIIKINFAFNDAPEKLLQWSIDGTKKFCHNNAFLYPLCRTAKPKITVETGVSAGASSSYNLSSS